MVLRQEVKEGDPWYSPHRFRVSPINYSEEVQGIYSFSTDILIQDGTLRKMEATPGARQYSIEEKLEIARLLDGVGVKELGTHPSLFEDTVKGESIIEGVRALCKAGLKIKVRASIHDLGWVKGDYSYLDMLADAGLAGVEINPGIPEFMRGPGIRVQRRWRGRWPGPLSMQAGKAWTPGSRSGTSGGGTWNPC